MKLKYNVRGQVGDKTGMMQWKRVEVKIENHIKVPSFASGMPMEFYDDCLSEYLTNIAMEQLPQTQPLWEIHVIKYPTSNAAGIVIFKLHHALGDGFSLMGALLSCLQRADNPSLPLSFPSRRGSDSKSKSRRPHTAILYKLRPFVLGVFNSVYDFGWSLLKSSMLKDDQTPIRSGGEGVEFRPIAFATVTFSLDHIKQIKAKLHVSINDVITGIVFYGTRLYMMKATRGKGEGEGEGMMSDESKTTALVLLNTRVAGGYKHIQEMLRSDAEMPWGNHFSFLHVPIPNFTHAEASNPLNFVSKAHHMINQKKNSFALLLTATLLETLRKFKGPEATARYIHGTLRNSSMAITNLIGPVEKMTFANHPIRGFYFNVTGAPQSLSVTMVSYAGNLRVSLGVEKGFIDPQEFKSCIQNAFNIMFRAATAQSVP